MPSRLVKNTRMLAQTPAAQRARPGPPFGLSAHVHSVTYKIFVPIYTKCSCIRIRWGLAVLCVTRCASPKNISSHRSQKNRTQPKGVCFDQVTSVETTQGFSYRDQRCCRIHRSNRHASFGCSRLRRRQRIRLPKRYRFHGGNQQRSRVASWCIEREF